MTAEKWIEIIACVLAGVATAIPLIVKLIQYVNKAVREKNWSTVLHIVMALMEDAEEALDNGPDRKKYVLDALDELSGSVNYDIDKEVISGMIDALCAMAKIVNGTK